MNDYDAIVVGAGAAGLAAALHLTAAGHRVLVCEARGRIGGRALTCRIRPDLPVDIGCGWLHSADRNPFVAIARRLGFTIDERLPDWSRREGTRAAWREAYGALEERIQAAAREPVDRAAAELLEPGGRWNATLNTISSFANATELDRVSVQDNARYEDTGVNWRIREGYGTLIAAWGAAAPLALGAAVRQITLLPDGVAAETGDASLRARVAIIAVPTSVLAEGRLAFLPDLAEKREAAAGLPLGLAAKLFLEVTAGWDALPADHHLLGSTERTQTGSYQLRPHGRPVVECYYGGSFAATLERGGIGEMARFAIEELTGHLGSAIGAHLRPVAASGWGTDPFAGGGYSCALPHHAGDRERLASPVDGRLFFAGEATHPSFFSTAHGAYLSGLRAAAEAAAALALS